MSKKNKVTAYAVCLPGSEHRQVKVKLDEDITDDDGGRLAKLIFPSDGIDVKLYMMESDLRILGKFLLKITNKELF